MAHACMAKLFPSPVPQPRRLCPCSSSGLLCAGAGQGLGLCWWLNTAGGCRSVLGTVQLSMYTEVYNPYIHTYLYVYTAILISDENGFLENNLRLIMTCWTGLEMSCMHFWT